MFLKKIYMSLKLKIGIKIIMIKLFQNSLLEIIDGIIIY